MGSHVQRSNSLLSNEDESDTEMNLLHSILQSQLFEKMDQLDRGKVNYDQIWQFPLFQYNSPQTTYHESLQPKPFQSDE